MDQQPGQEGRKKSSWGLDPEIEVHRRDGSSVEATEHEAVEITPDEATIANSPWAAMHAGYPLESEGDDDSFESLPVPKFDHDTIDVADALFSDDVEITAPAQDSLWSANSAFLEEEAPKQEVEFTSTSTQFHTAPDETANLYSEVGDDSSWLLAANDIVNRYVNQDDLYETVRDILAIANSGDPVVQNVIRSFVLTRDPEIDRRQRRAYQEVLAAHMPQHGIYIPNPADTQLVFDIAYDELLGIGPLGPLWRDDDVVDILVNGPSHVTVERNGKLVSTPVRFRDLAHLQSTARRLSTLIDDRAVSRTNPIVTVQLPGARVQLVWEPIAEEGASLVIRKHRPQLGLGALVQAGALSSEMVAFMADAVSSRATVLVSGATGSGKTTYLNVLSSFIPRSERVIVIEDARELKLENEEVEYMLTKSAATADDPIVFGFDKLLRASLRMRPDRIIVGEIIDALGAQAMLEAAFTGHDGTMSTLHANNPQDALVRIAGLLRQATGMPEDLSRKQVNATFDLVVQVSRDPSGKRLVTYVSAVNPDGTVDDIFRGRVLPDGTTEFVRSAPLRADTPLAQRMKAAAVDLTPWEQM